MPERRGPEGWLMTGPRCNYGGGDGHWSRGAMGCSGQCVSVSWGCRDKTNFLMVLEARNPRSECCQGWFLPPEASLLGL
jgi:hypothetical protein